MSTYAAPNTTQIPNVLLDVHLREMSEAELRVVLAVCRKTLGWQKRRDRISMTQLEQMTGLSRQGVINGVQAAISRGVLKRIKTPQGNEYELILSSAEGEGSQRSRLPLVNVVDSTSQRSRHTKDIIVNDSINNNNILSVNEVDSPGQPGGLPAEGLATVMRAYENNIAMLTPYMAQVLTDAVAEYPPDWIVEAIHVAVENNARNWRYISAILRNWQEKGKGEKRKPKVQTVTTEDGGFYA